MLKIYLYLLFLLPFSAFAATNQYSAWPTYSGEPGGERYSSLNQITPENVKHLKVAWVYHTGENSAKIKNINPTTFEATPILFLDKLYFCTPFNRVIALNPQTGKEIWSYDPKIDIYAHQVQNFFSCRGVSAWTDTQATENTACKYRIFTATHDGRLIALDAENGSICKNFGTQGVIDLKTDVLKPLTKETFASFDIFEKYYEAFEAYWDTQMGNTAAPTVANDLVIVGSSLDDSIQIEMPHGLLRAYDAKSGKLVWEWNPVPKDYPGKTGAMNVWGDITYDKTHDMLLVGTTSPSPDYYGAFRKAPLPYANAVVALEAKTGKVIWSYQTVHHDLFDYDLAAQPTVVTINKNGQAIPAVVQATKSGFIFILDLKTGKPLFPVAQQRVPQSDVPGEQVSPTQPVPLIPKPLLTQTLTEKSLWGLTPFDRAWCRKQFKKYRYEGMFTPISLRGTIEYPSTAGGINWGGVSYNPQADLVFINYTNIAQIVRLYPRDVANEIGYGNNIIEAPMIGTPYALSRTLLLSPLGVPCSPPPWGGLAALQLSTGKYLWNIPFGSVKKRFFNTPKKWGSPNVGGSMTTASGLLFIGASLDKKFHAYDMWTGNLLWTKKLPGVAAATPMTYSYQGKQYIIVAAGGGRGTPPNLLSDALVAFTLKK